ncbi:MAG: hypothetical protein R2810_16375 [Flavobacteriales bacterium]
MAALKEPELFSPPRVAVLDSPLGKLWLAADAGLLTHLSFEALEGRSGRKEPVLDEARRQLEQYFRRKRKAFDLPLQRTGTRFQRLVWERMPPFPSAAPPPTGPSARPSGERPSRVPWGVHAATTRCPSWCPATA